MRGGGHSCPYCRPHLRLPSHKHLTEDTVGVTHRADRQENREPTGATFPGRGWNDYNSAQETKWDLWVHRTCFTPRNSAGGGTTSSPILHIGKRRLAKQPARCHPAPEPGKRDLSPGVLTALNQCAHGYPRPSAGAPDIAAPCHPPVSSPGP